MHNIEPVAARAQTTLRRRMHVLEKAHKTEEGTGTRRERNLSEETVMSPSDYESESEDSDDGHGQAEDRSNDVDDAEDDGQQTELDADAQDIEESPVSENLNLRPSPGIPSYSLPRDRSWYEFDLTVVAALVSPIGNWLTGGDHVKNVVVVLLLLFYLHQIIEVPWSLYHKARPRERPPHIRSQRTSAEERYRELASSELRKFELLLLVVTVLSPFIGAYLIRLISSAVLGKDSFSWFSISLFVLATGVRPWSHVAQRIAGRVTDLHNIVHYPSHHPNSNGDSHSELADIRKHLRRIDQSISQLHRKSTTRTQEMYDYVDDALDVLEKTMRRHEKKQEEKHRDLEKSVRKINRPTPPPVTTVDPSSSPRAPRSLAQRLSALLSIIFPSFYSSAIYRKNVSDDGRTSPPSTVTRYSVPSPSSPKGLETIVEESGPLPEVHFLSLPARLFLRFAYFALFPLRSVSRMVLGHS